MKRFLIFALLVLTFVALACSPFIASRQAEHVPEESQIVVPEPIEVIQTPVASPIPELVFPKATYQDTTSHFEFDYPKNWAFDDGEKHSRGYYVQFYSWNWQPGDLIETTPPGETILSVTVNYWDPKNDLQAFVSQRKMAFESSGMLFLAEERITLTRDLPAVQLIVKGTDNAQSYFLFTTVGEQYLTISGSGDIALLTEISHTLRPTQ
jgi:hypothetical protein